MNIEKWIQDHLDALRAAGLDEEADLLEASYAEESS